jgi:hypothetical protein
VRAFASQGSERNWPLTDGTVFFEGVCALNPLPNPPHTWRGNLHHVLVQVSRRRKSPLHVWGRV